MAEEKKVTKTVETNSNVIAALSYFWILSVVFYVTNKNDKFVVFHARQGMVLFALSLLSMIPVFGWMIAPVITLVVLVASLIGAIKAYQNEEYRLPVVADLAEKINF